MSEIIKWSLHPEVANRLLELDARKFTKNEIAAKVREEFPEIIPRTPTRDQIKNALERSRARMEYIGDKSITDIMPYFNKYRKYIEGDAPARIPAWKKSRLKILVLSDTHVPFTDESKLQKAVDLNRGADILILAGDIMDMYSCSRHRLRMSVPLEIELDNTVRLFEYFSSIFPLIYVFEGNHDARATKKIRDLLPPQLLFLFDESPLKLLTKPFPNIYYHNDWWLQIGDAIIAHAEISSAYEGRPPVLLSEWFLKKGWAKRFNLDEIRCFVLSHTHQVSSVYREDLKLMECGCLAQVMEYATDPTARMRPPMNGCVVLTQQYGRTDFNESREFVL